MTLASIVGNIIQFIKTLIPIVTALAVVVFLAGIVQYIYAGTQGKKDQSKDIMTWGFIALFVIFSLWGILSVIKGVLLPAGY